MKIIKKEDVKLRSCFVKDLFIVKRGRVLSKQYIIENPGNYDVYSSSTEKRGLLGKISTFDISGEKITWTTDGYYAGTVFYRNGKFSCTNVCGVLSKKNNDIDVKYFSYLFNSFFYKYVTKTDNRKLMSNTVENIKFKYIPDFLQQEKIANILSMQEEQIERIKGLIKKLEKRNQYYAEKLLSGELRIREGEDGSVEFYENTEWQEVVLNGDYVKIPVGWKVEKLINIMNFEKGDSIHSELLNYNGHGTQYLRTNEVWDGSTVNKEKVYFDGDLKHMYLKKKNEYVVCFDGFNSKPNSGTLGMVTNNGEGIISSELKKIITIESTSKYYVNVMILLNDRFQKTLCKHAEGTTVKHAGKHIKKIEEVLIPFLEQKKLDVFFKKCLNDIDDLKTILPKEEKRFQWMLNNLLSGEYEVVED